MTMQCVEHELRQTGDPRDLERAAIIRAMREARGEDILLPSAEAPVEIKRFSKEAREALIKKGYVIYGLKGQSLKTLREADRKFWSARYRDYPEVEVLTSRLTEVAINPGSLFLSGSNRKTLKEQEEVIREFSQSLSEKIKGVEAIIGEVPDYVELAFQHLDVTGDYLFGEKYKYNYTRTKTLTAGSRVANVGYFHAVYGLDVSSWFRGYGYDIVWVASLVVPQ